MLSRYKIFGLLFIATALLILIGCPVSTSYPLGEMNAEPIDDRLIGTWQANSKEVEVLKMTISKADEFTYDVKVDKVGPKFKVDTNVFKCWITTIENKKFFVVKDILGTSKIVKPFFAYHFEFKQGKIYSHDINFKVCGIDSVTSTPAYREAVINSINKDGFLTGEIIWTKK